MEGRQPNERVFINQRGEPLTRFGIYGVLRASVARASASVPSLRSKRISPHRIRHSTATHLLRAYLWRRWPTAQGWHSGLFARNLVRNLQSFDVFSGKGYLPKSFRSNATQSYHPSILTVPPNALYAHGLVEERPRNDLTLRKRKFKIDDYRTLERRIL